LDGIEKNKGKKGGFLKYIIVLAIGLIGGNVASKYSGLQSRIKN